MGSGRSSHGAGGGGIELLSALVVPDVPSMSVDGGFWYGVPDGMSPSIGSLVRVPLGGRVVRGWVVAVGDAARSDLKAIRRVSGEHAVFDEQLLSTLRWAAHHYVAPVSALLKKPAPPNLPRRLEARALPEVPEVDGPFEAIGAEAASGTAGPPVVVAARVTGEAIASALAPVLAADRSAMVVMPTGIEAQSLYDRLGELGARVVVVHPDMSDRQVTDRWSRVCEQPGHVLIGTERVSLWPVAGLALGWMVGDGRRGLKARQTPTLHVRDVLRRRAAAERFRVIYSSSVPTTEALAAGSRVLKAPGRAWPRTEVIDRGDDPPGGGVIGERARVAVAGSVNAGRTVFVFTHRHGYAPAFRCVRCRALRVCGTCEARATGGAECPRCGTELSPCSSCAGRTFEPLGAGVGRVTNELGNVVGAERVGPVGSAAPVWVGTERDLPRVVARHLSIAVDADGLMFGSNYRAAEDALRMLARVAATVTGASGSRFMVQTSRPSHPVIVSLQRGDPMSFLEQTMDERRADLLPPLGELLVLEIENPPSWIGERLSRLTVAPHGPMPSRDRHRWLFQAGDLERVRTELRPIVQDARDAGARVRIDADPIDL